MARSFNGTSDLIAVDGAVLNPTFSTSTFTVAGWLNGAAQQNKALYSEGRAATAAFFYLATQNGTPNNKFLCATSSGAFATSTAVICDSTWHHVAVTFDGSGNWVMYVDGVSDKTGHTVFGNLSLDRATLGALRRSTTGNWFAGGLAHWATWTRTLAAQEIVSLHNGMLPSLLGPTHYWPLWGADSPEPDLGNGTHGAGTLTGTGFVSGVGQPSMLHV